MLLLHSLPFTYVEDHTTHYQISNHSLSPPNHQSSGLRASMASHLPCCLHFPTPSIPTPSSSSSSSREHQLTHLRFSNLSPLRRSALRRTTHGLPRKRTRDRFKRLSLRNQTRTESDSESEPEIEFERLFSNLNEATLKREPGSSLSLSLSLALTFFSRVFFANDNALFVLFALQEVYRARYS